MGQWANSAPGPLFCSVGWWRLSSTTVEQFGTIIDGENPMRDTEIVLTSPETDTRETPTQGLNEHHDTKQRPRARGRGENGSCPTAPSPRRQPRRRAARPAERRSTTGEARLSAGAGTGAMTENS